MMPTLDPTTAMDPDHCRFLDPNVSWESPLWSWTRTQQPKPSCEAAMDGDWSRSLIDIPAGRNRAGFGVTIDIINCGIEPGAQLQLPQQIEEHRTVTSVVSLVWTLAAASIAPP